MRIGVAPTKDLLSDYRPARVTACVLTFIPHQLGYYARRVEVLRLCLRSLIENTSGRHELLVLDNGSCADVVDYLRALRDNGDIDCLILLKQNVGKLTALRMMFEAAPGDVIAYSDDDIFFSPGWLEAQLEVLDTYPRVGMVSARPVRKQFGYGNRYLPAYLEEFKDVTAQYGHFIPEEWEAEFLHSTGRSLAGLETIARSRTDILLDCKGLKAYSTAAHFQFVAPKRVLLEAVNVGCTLPTRLLGGDRCFEEAIDGMGYARLSTHGRFVRHIGNVVTDTLLKEVAAELPTGDAVRARRRPRPFLARLAQRRLPRAVLRRLHEWTYLLLHDPRP